jgi:hypothetical protein
MKSILKLFCDKNADAGEDSTDNGNISKKISISTITYILNTMC